MLRIQRRCGRSNGRCGRRESEVDMVGLGSALVGMGKSLGFYCGGLAGSNLGAACSTLHLGAACVKLANGFRGGVPRHMPLTIVEERADTVDAAGLIAELDSVLAPL